MAQDKTKDVEEQESELDDDYDASVGLAADRDLDSADAYRAILGFKNLVQQQDGASALPLMEARPAAPADKPQSKPADSPAPTADTPSAPAASDTRPVESKLANGTSITREGENGNITSMLAPDGRRRSMEYTNGLLMAVKDANGVEYKREGDKWVQTDASGKRTELKEFTVDPQTGELKAKLENGNTLTVAADGSQVETDSNNRIARTTSATGALREFGYDAEGKLNRVKDSRGDWRSENGTDWNKYSPEGAKTNETWKGDISVKPDGTYTEKGAVSGNEATRRPDGSVVTVNKDGRVTSMVDGTGRSREFEYDASGKLNKVKDGSTVWTSTDGENWKREGSNETWKGRISVKPDGTYEEVGGTSGNVRTFTRSGEMSYKNPQGDLLEQKRLDGSTVTYNYKDGKVESAREVNRDGVTALLDAQGRITQVQDKTGATRTFERDEQGRVTRIRESNGSEWNLSADGKHYELKGGQGEKVPAEGLQINKDGSYQFKLEDGKQARRNMDGSVSRLDPTGKEMMRANADGSMIAYDRQGRIVASTDARGQTRQYGYDGASKTPNMVREPDGQVWRSNDGKNWTKEGSHQTRSGEVIVGADGSQTVRNSRGEETTFKLDGSTVTRDKDGRVTETKDAEGRERKFEYDASGNLKVYRDGNETWRTRDGKTWQKEGGSTWNGSITVDKDGTVHEKYASGKEVIKQTDGWQKIQENGKTRLEHKEENGSTVVKNEQGQTTEVRYPNGQTRAFEYDAQGRINKMTDRTGTWTSTDGQNWKKEGSTETWKGRMEVGEHGIYRELPDNGKQRVFKNDGSVVEANAEGKITKITTANGQTREFEYGADGKINKMKDTAGNVWTTTDGKSWQKQGSTDAPWKGTVNVRPDGTYEERSENTGNRTVSLTDGRKATYDSNGRIVRSESAEGQSTDFKYDSTGKPSGFEVTNKDGSQVFYDAKGLVTKTRDKNGGIREFGYDDNGKLNRVKGPDGVTWTSSDGDNWRGSNGQNWRGRAFVAPDGQYSEIQGNTLTTRQLDGNTKYTDASGATRLVNPQNQILETKDAKGVVRSYGYDSAGNVNRFTEDGRVWERQGNSRDWVRQDAGGRGQRWNGTIKVEADGTYYQEDSNRNREWRKPDGGKEEANYQTMRAAAKAIYDASWGPGTDEDKFQGALEGKTVRQRQMMNEIYQEEYKMTIEQEARSEMEGHDLEKTLALLNKGDGADNAGTIRVALTELGQYIYGRSSSECLRVIRDTLETMSAAEIAEADKQYRERYNGQSLSDAVLNNPNVPETTKEALRIYLKGHDQRTPAESTWLARRAAERGDETMFQEVMRRAPKETRDYFKSAEGQQLLKDHFSGSWYNFYSETRLNHVQDYAEFGRLSAATQTRDNTSWLGDNEKAIEQGLHNMPDSERELYKLGRQIARGESVAASVSQEERDRAKRYYDTVQTAFKAAGNQNEQQKWEDMILYKGGSLVSRLAEHRGSIYDSSMHDVISTVENMSEADWKRLKEDPQYKQRVEQILDTYLNAEEKARVMDVINRKQGAGSYEDSQQQRRPVIETIDDNMRWYNNAEDQIYRALENMTKAEQESYRRGSDPNCPDNADRRFARALDEKLRSALDSDEQKVAFGLLDKVKRGEKPEMSIMDKLNLQASYLDADEAQVVRDIQEAFKKDPGLQERIKNPQTEEDRRFSEQFKDAARRAMGSWDYEKYITPLIRDGRLSIELQMDLNRGIFNDDEQGAYRDVQNASEAERQRILTDPVFQERVLGYLSPAERQIALNAMRQGEMRPEDKLRSYMVGAGTSEDEIKQLLAEIKNKDNYKDVPPEEVEGRIRARLEEIKREYAKKYGSDLTVDLIGELGGSDLREVRRNVDQRDARSEYLFARDQASVTRSGFGSGFVDAVWDGTGYQLDNEVNTLSRMMVEDPAKVQEYVGQLYKAIDTHAESKEALADAIVDTTIAAVGIGGAFFTGGVSLSLLMYTGAAGALLKVGTKAAIMGGDYDAASAQLVLDAGTGFADGFTTFLGAGAAKSAAQKTLQAGGKALMREGAEQSLKEGAEALIKQGLKEGGKLSDDAIRALAKNLAKEGQEEALFQLLRKSMGEAIVEQSRTMLKQMVMHTPSNILAGMAGGGASGTIRAGFEARSAEDFLFRAGTSAGFGAFGGGVAPFVIAPIAYAGGRAWRAAGAFFRGADNAADNAGAHVVPRPHEGGTGPHDTPPAPKPGDAPPAPKPGDTTVPRETTPGPHDSPTAPREIQGPVPRDAVAPSNDYAKNNKIKDRIPDGFTTAGAGTEIHGNGSFDAPRAAVVVDRQSDTVLRNTIEEARQHLDQLARDFGPLSPQDKLAALQEFVRGKFKLGTGDSVSANRMFQDMYTSFMTENAGKRVALGDMIGKGMGGCSEQALLLKVLADDLGIPGVSLVRGNGTGGNSINHVWTTLDQGGGKPELIFDPRQDVSGKPYSDRPGYYRPASEITPGGDQTPRPGEAGGWRIARETPDGKVVLQHDGARIVSPQEAAALADLNPQIRQEGLKVGQEYKIRKADGSIDDGWKVQGFNENGDAVLVKKNAVEVTVPKGEMRRYMPELSNNVTPEQAIHAIDNAKTSDELMMAAIGALDHADNKEVMAALKHRIEAELKDPNSKIALRDLMDMAGPEMSKDLAAAFKAKAAQEIATSPDLFKSENLSKLRQALQELGIEGQQEIKDALSKRISAELKNNPNLFSGEEIHTVRNLIKELGLQRDRAVREALEQRLIAEFGKEDILKSAHFETIRDMIKEMNLGSSEALKAAVGKRVAAELKTADLSDASFLSRMKDITKDLSLTKDKEIRDALFDRVMKEMKANPGGKDELFSKLKELSDHFQENRSSNQIRYYEQNGEVSEHTWLKVPGSEDYHKLSDAQLRKLGEAVSLQSRVNGTMKERQFLDEFLGPFGFEGSRSSRGKHTAVVRKGTETTLPHTKGGTVGYNVSHKPGQKDRIPASYQEDFLDAVQAAILRNELTY